MSQETTTTGKRKYVKKNKAHWNTFKKKKAAKKKAAKKQHSDAEHGTFFHRPKKDMPPLHRTESQSNMLLVVLYAIDLMNTAEKATVFGNIIGRTNITEEQMWAIDKILKD
jgi:hypothetical protein